MNSKNNSMNKNILRIIIQFSFLPILFFSLLIGASDEVNAHRVLQMLSGFDSIDDLDAGQTIVYKVRLPRILLVYIVGGVLAVSGSAMQSIFRNPLVDSYILGLSSGAAFGAALALATNFISVQFSAFLFGLIAVVMSYFMAMKNKQVSVVSLILSGIITNGIFTALLTIVQMISDPFKLQSIVHWTMGNFHIANWDKLYSILFPAVLGLAIIYFLRWKLDILSLGDEEAISVGLSPTRLKLWVLFAITLSSSAVISVSGIIGLYGLVVPHIVRMIFGVSNRTTLMLNFWVGGGFLVLIDNISRSFQGLEIPIGVFTMLFSAPFFIWLLKNTKTGWQ